MKRRSFIRKTAAGTAAFSIVPSFVLGKNHVPPSDTLYVAAFGVGGRGRGVIDGLNATRKVKFVALCDVDQQRAARTFSDFPEVPRFTDFRRVYDQSLGDIDAIMVATPDHTHASTALPFMRARKHAYVEKPLTHNIYEARLMARVAAENGLVTQMGNQGASSEGSRIAKEWVDAGAIGRVHTVDCWSNRPVWPQGVALPEGRMRVPRTLDWDLWLGPASERPYHKAYLPFKWRGFWDFGTGALGDMGCHIIETPFSVLGLGHPKEAEASCTTVWVDDFVQADYAHSCPPSSKIHLKFDHPQHGEIALNWYDGGIMPDLPDELGTGETVGDFNGGTIMYGERGILVTDTYSRNARLLPSNLMNIFRQPEPTEPRIPDGMDGHVANFVEGCLQGRPTASDFSRAGLLTEIVLMGNLAVRAFQYREVYTPEEPESRPYFVYPGRQKLQWDGEAMRITNYEPANQWVRREYREGWALE